MTNRLLVLAGSFLAGLVWIGLLSLLLWDERDGRAAALLLDLNTETFRYPFTIQNVMWLVFFVATGELFVRQVAGSS